MLLGLILFVRALLTLAGMSSTRRRLKISMRTIKILERTGLMIRMLKEESLISLLG